MGTRASFNHVKYLGKLPFDPKDSFSTRAAQSAASKRRAAMIAKNVGELIDILKKLDPTARVLTIDPPFEGLKVVDQENGSFLFCRPRTPETKATPHSSAAVPHS